MNVYIIEVPVAGVNMYLVKAKTQEEALEIAKKRSPEQTRDRIQWENANVVLQGGGKIPKIKVTTESMLRKPHKVPKPKTNADTIDWRHWAKIYNSGVSAREIAKEIGCSHAMVYKYLKEFVESFSQKTGRKRNELSSYHNPG
jgi:DNA invertase Pin-like site-specific DNA recombinase